MDLVRNVLLAVGAGVIVAAAVVTLRHLDDRVVTTVLVPGCVLGAVLIVISTQLGKDRGGPAR